MSSLAGISSCTQESHPQAKVTTEVTPPMALQTFSQSLKNLQAAFAQDEGFHTSIFQHVHQEGRRASAPLSLADQKKLNAIISEFTSKSDSFLRAFGIKDIAQLTTEERLVLSLLIYADNHKIAIRQEPRGGAITDYPVVDCALSALGLSEATKWASGRLTDLASKAGGKALLKTVAKFAGKSLSTIGWALAAYDFATCMADELL